jgi:hypothetical protein
MVLPSRVGDPKWFYHTTPAAEGQSTRVPAANQSSWQFADQATRLAATSAHRNFETCRNCSAPQWHALPGDELRLRQEISGIRTAKAAATMHASNRHVPM